MTPSSEQVDTHEPQLYELETPSDSHKGDDDAVELLLGLEGLTIDPDYDRWLAKMVIDRGLSTSDEVLRAIKKARGGVLRTKRPLGEILVEMLAVTPSQLSRVEQEIETERAGRTIPGFKMLDTLGKGTSASVFKARQESLGRIVAIKVLPPKSLAKKRLVEAFYEEGRAAAQLNHPNIVQAYDVGRHGDLLYFVMEYVEGRNVHDLLKEYDFFSADDALDIVIGIAQGLAHAHERGLIHRDVKPKNIMIVGGNAQGAGNQCAKLADLGLARFENDAEAAKRDYGRSLGTPYYISPEQVRGDMEIGPASDIYSLGATWHHMATGKPLFTGGSAREVMEKHLEEPPPSLGDTGQGLDVGLGEVMIKMVAKAPEARYPDCQSLLTELCAWRKVLELRAGEEERSGTQR